jgi:hypothetical protein
VSAVGSVGDSTRARVIAAALASDILPLSKFITAPAPSIKSVPNRPAASVGSAHTKNVTEFAAAKIELYRLSSLNRQSVCPVTPCGLIVVASTTFPDILGCKIETFDPVLTTRFRVVPSMASAIDGVPLCQPKETEGVAIAFSGGAEVERAVCFHTLSPFSELVISLLVSRSFVPRVSFLGERTCFECLFGSLLT